MRIVKRIEKGQRHPIRSIRSKIYNERIDFYSNISREIQEIENKLARIRKMIKSYSVDSNAQYPYTLDVLAPGGKPDLNKIIEFIRYMGTRPSDQELGTKEQFYQSLREDFKRHIETASSKVSRLFKNASQKVSKAVDFLKNLLSRKRNEDTQKIQGKYNRRNRQFVYYSDASSEELDPVEFRLSVEVGLQYAEQELGFDLQEALSATKFAKYRKSSRFYSSAENDIDPDELEDRKRKLEEKLNEMIIHLQKVRIKAWRFIVYVPLVGAAIAFGIFIGAAAYYAHLFLGVKAVITMAMKAVFAQVALISLAVFVALVIFAFWILPWIIDWIDQNRINSAIKQAESIVQQAYKNQDKIDYKTLEDLGSVFSKYSNKIKTDLIDKYKETDGAPVKEVDKLIDEMLHDARLVVA